MAKKVAILGGGIASLTTAMEMTNDPNWKDDFDITIYQMGWRLGGKGASGRNRKMSDRIQEHGIHLWMGFYENAFHMIRAAYKEATLKNLMPTSPFKDARDAFSPMNYTPMMEQFKGKWQQWDIHWPPNNEFPGDDSLFQRRLPPPTPLGLAQLLLQHLTDRLDGAKDKHPLIVRLYEFGMGRVANAVGAGPAVPAAAAPRGPHTALHAISAFFQTLEADVTKHAEGIHDDIVGWLKKFIDRILDLVADEIETDPELRHLVIVLETGLCIAVGMLADRVIRDGFMVIEDQDFIAWLAKHGCRHAASPLTIGMYDACFGYQHGQRALRLMGAGSTLYGALRLMLTYKGALMWWMNAGMGETIMSPLYLVLKSRGVKFKFFHKVTDLGLSPDKRNIETIDIEVQATTKAGDYYPLFTGIDGIPVWPTEPVWDQLVEGDAIQKCKNPDLESWWTDWHGTNMPPLKRGQDFDLVVLGISLGAHQYITQELMRACSAWNDMVTKVEVVRTQALQLWMNRSLKEVGWTTGRGILAAYEEPFDTWSDMSDLIQRETWPADTNVRQIAYFCNVIPDDVLEPFSHPDYPQKELARVKTYSRDFMDQYLPPIWPKAGDARNPGHFDDSILVNCALDPKQANFDTQFFRVNIDPSELYVLSLPGTAKYRLESSKSGFDNLYLAGDWTLTNLNIGCIEAAVTSGRLCSRAICGKPDYIYGTFGSLLAVGGANPPK